MSASFFQAYWVCPHCGDRFLRLRWVSKDKSKAAYECEACELEHVRCTYTVSVFDWREMRKREDGYESERVGTYHGKNMRKPKIQGERTFRQCLNFDECGNSFWAETKYIRLCSKCTKNNRGIAI
jgi:hypothetical protein